MEPQGPWVPRVVVACHESQENGDTFPKDHCYHPLTPQRGKLTGMHLTLYSSQDTCSVSVSAGSCPLVLGRGKGQV